ncbi:MAG: (Fe-S)-binding protein [Thermodesulfobacteriota bacterium]|nr:(Fe-S)-binding protein [Thermodesulfobacteriota bacterium]
MADFSLIDQAGQCMKCGFCMSSCPVYGVDHVESHVARGRNMVVLWAENSDIPTDNSYTEILYYCLLCRRCETVCPARIPSASITLKARANRVKQQGLTWTQRFIYRGIIKHRSILARILGSAARLPGFSAKEARPIRHLADFTRIFSRGISVPRLSKPFLSKRLSYRTHPPTGTKARGEVAVFPGCAFEFFFAEVGDNVVSALSEAGFEVVYLDNLTCCGLAVSNAGDVSTARLMARHNIEMLSRFDHIVTGCATCGSTLKSYGNWFPETDPYQSKARDFSTRVEDLSEFLLRKEYVSHGKATSPVTVTYHDPCHLRWHQGIDDAPRKILDSLEGVTYIEMEDAGDCCGLGGSFGITHREASRAILEKKMESVKKAKASVVVTSCPGCMIQLMDGIRRHRAPIEVMHISQLLCGQRPGRLPR